MIDQVLYCGALALLVYGLVGYPGLALLRAHLWPRPWRRGACQPRISVIVAARDEEAHIEGKLDSLLGQDYPADRLEIVVVSDGSRDRTAELVRLRCAAGGLGERLKLVELPWPRGKAMALNAGMAVSQGELLVFTDARQRPGPGALERLARNFADPEVGAVGAVVELQARSGAAGLERGLPMYARLESALRRAESQTGSTVGLAGALYAVRRELCPPFAAGLVLDDLWLPLQVVRQGYRAVIDETVVIHDLASPSPERELDRRVRTLAGHYQLFQLEPWVLSPRQNPLWFELVSHKVARLLMPLAVAVLLVQGARMSHALLPNLVTGGLLLGAILALASARLGRVPLVGRLASMARTFYALVVAATLAPWRLREGTERLWRPAGGPPVPELTERGRAR